ncbi:MAG: glucose-phosphate adenylyltransferase [Candidatus Poribacteria bacterium]|nr:glucose-phosphate adenylyltransferase [Candidatus Poribacteria bacterium]
MSNDTHVLSFVMAGGNGSRLKILTKHRCKPALDILGNYKIFDFVASNIVNTGIPVSLVATQFRPESLCPHIRETWCGNSPNSEFEIVNPNEEESNISKFEGTADSVRKSMSRIDKYNPDIILVLGADHIYFMDYEDAIIQHDTSNVDITIMTNTIPDNKVSDFGIVKINEFRQIIDFAEKPTDKELIDSFRLNPGIKRCLGIEDPNLNYLASMGNYVFRWERLKKFMDFPGVDFGKDLIPAIKANGGNILAYVFNGYWRDVGKVQDYFDCNMEFTQKPMSFLSSWIGASEEPLPPPQVDSNSFIKKTILNPGDVVNPQNSIVNSVLGRRVVIEEKCTLNHCILLGADRNNVAQTNEGEYATRIGKGSILNNVILDKNVWIGERVNISPRNGTLDRRKAILEEAGLKSYKELNDGSIEGDFYIEPETGILVIGKQSDIDPEKPILPDGLVC